MRCVCKPTHVSGRPGRSQLCFNLSQQYAQSIISILVYPAMTKPHRNRRPSHVGHVQPGASADDVGSRGGSGVPSSPPAQRGDASPIPFAATKAPRHKGYQGRRLLPAWGSLFDSLPPGLHQQRSRGHVGSIVHSVDRHGRGRRSSCYRRRLRCRKPRKRQRRRRHPALMQPPEDNRAGDVEEDPQRAQAPRASCRGTHQHYLGYRVWGLGF